MVALMSPSSFMVHYLHASYILRIYFILVCIIPQLSKAKISFETIRDQLDENIIEDWGGIFGTHDARDSVVANLTNLIGDSYDIRGHSTIEVFSKETCKLPQNEKRCKGNNPDSGYIAFGLERIPGEAPFTPYSNRFREDEAVIYFGKTPPLAKYFGHTEYLNTVSHEKRSRRRNKRLDIQASLQDSTNPSNINVISDGSYSDSFNKDYVIISSADQNMYDILSDALQQIGIPSEIFNRQVWSKEVIKFGVFFPSDTLSTILRVAFFENEIEGQNYYADPPITLLRITPKVQKEILPYPIPIRAPFARGSDEEKYQEALNKLEKAIRRSTRSESRVMARTVPVELNGEKCLITRTQCFFDSPDSAYYGNVPGKYFNRNTYFIVFGTNHVKTGFARYSSVTLYNADNLISVASFTSANDMENSAKRFLPDHKYADKLFAITLRQKCSNEKFCVEVNVQGRLRPPVVVFASRAYMHPNGTKGASFDDLLPMRVIHGEERVNRST